MARRRSCGLLLALAVAAVLVAAGAGAQETCSGAVPAPPRRGARVSVASFGGAGDGRTLNTAAFARAVASIESLRAPGGAELYVPPGVWLTGPFNLTSRMTLFLARGAVIRATQDPPSWPLIEALPSYGRGRELPGGRYISLIHGSGLQDVVITGENGTIDGQGSVWWDMWKKGTLPYTRPHLLELMSSSDIIVSNVVFQDSPFWNIHPVYCSNVVIRNVTVLAPHDSPNTDGIDPDSSSNVCIEDCYIATGDDAVAIKSGWDEYGIAYGRPSSDITVRRITGSSPFAGFAVGSETSGGVQNVLAEHLNFFSSGLGIHIKTNTGRGGFIRNITISAKSTAAATMAPPRRNLLLVIPSVLVVLLTTTAAALSVSTPVELTVTSPPPVSFHLPPARPISGGEGGAAGGHYCTRVLLHGRPSRLRDPSRFFHALRLRANATRPHGLELCFHRNATVGPCKCAASQWQKMPKSGLWVQAISPYDRRILDFRMVAEPSRSVVVSTEEEFLLHRVVFLVLGLVLMGVAHTLSESLVFYYGGAMTIGIFLVVLIILFQGMKLLPTGRKSSLAIFAYSSVVGMTTYFLHYLSGLLRSVLVEIGIAEDMHNPLGIFLLVLVILAGAWFGYWGVRKLVLTEDGSVDAGVAYFVEWAILIVSAVMILQSSLDYLFAFAAFAFCVIIKAIARIEGKSGFFGYLSRGLSGGTAVHSSHYGDLGEEYSSMNGTYQDGFGKLHGHLRRTPRKNSPLAGSAKSSPGIARDSYYSSYHTTPERRKFSKEEYEAFTREETKKAMKQLLSSPDFNSWALANADRISVTPAGGNYSSSSQKRHRLFGLF